MTLRDTEDAAASVGRGRQRVITRTPPELLLFLSSRDAVQVDFTGDDDTVERCAPPADDCRESITREILLVDPSRICSATESSV